MLNKRATFSAITKADKKLFWSPVWGRMLNLYSEGPDAAEQGQFLAPPVKGECAESAMTWALNGVESTLGT